MPLHGRDRIIAAFEAQNVKRAQGCGTLATLTAGPEYLPRSLKLLNWGENMSAAGLIRVSDRTVASLRGNQLSRGFEEVALDFEHNTVPGTEEYERSREPRQIAAYGLPTVIPGEGLFLERLRWTPAGKEHALDYPGVSPAMELDEASNVVFVHSAALTRQPLGNNLHQVRLDGNRGWVAGGPPRSHFQGR